VGVVRPQLHQLRQLHVHRHRRLNTSWIRANVVCFTSNGCPRSQQFGILAMRNVVVTISDPRRRAWQ
jgi:hypothetical protein